MNTTTFAFLLLAFIAAPALAQQSRCPRVGLSGEIQRTSGCEYSGDRTSDLVTRRHSLQRVNRIFREFRGNIETLKNDVHAAQEELLSQYVEMPDRAISDLHPEDRDTRALTNTRSNNPNRILRELRWWITTIEAALLRVDSAGQLDQQCQGSYLAGNATRLSTELHLLIKLFNVNVASLPPQARCREYYAQDNDDSTTDLVNFTLRVLQDVKMALERVAGVLSHCEAVRHSHGMHRVRLDCSGMTSVFYRTNHRMNVSRFYSLTDF